MYNNQIERSKSKVFVELIDFKPDTLFTKTIFRRKRGNVTIISVGAGDAVIEKANPLKKIFRVIEGIA